MGVVPKENRVDIMFTGIIQALGKVASMQPQGDNARLSVLVSEALQTRLEPGFSLAVNGVCLTVVSQQGLQVDFDVSLETLQCTHLASLKAGDYLNLESALTLSTPLGGHLVTGHVDGVAQLTQVRIVDQARCCRFELPSELLKYIAVKGSICVDGVSLTVNTVSDTGFEVMIIPHTWEHTIFQYYQLNDSVNIEVDLMARYAQRLSMFQDKG